MPGSTAGADLRRLPPGLAGLVFCLCAAAAAAQSDAVGPWQEIHRQDGVLVETASGGGDVVLVRGRDTLAFSHDAVVATLLDLPSFPRLFPSLSTWTILQGADHAAVVYGRHHLPWPFDDRDYTVRYTWQTEPDGTFVLASRSIADSGPAPQSHVVRLTAVRSTWRAVATGAQQTEVSYSYNGELGGSFPDWLRRGAWKKEVVDLFANLRREVAYHAGGAALLQKLLRKEARQFSPRVLGGRRIVR